MLALTPATDAPTAETVWIDLVNPSEAERRLIEDHIGARLPTLEDLSEIERSSQLVADGQVLRVACPCRCRGRHRSSGADATSA